MKGNGTTGGLLACGRVDRIAPHVASPEVFSSAKIACVCHLQGAPLVGKYVVDVPAFEALAFPAMKPQSPATQLVVIDEVGECHSVMLLAVHRQRQPNTSLAS
jgi:hypothetical protein